MTEWLGSITGAASDIVGSGLQSILYATIYKLLYYIASGLCWVLGLFGDMFETLSGLNQVVYDGSKDYLINVFFSNDAVANAYWGMALIGIVLCFAFAIMGVVKKSFDTNEKEKRSHGQILGSLFKSILIIISLSALMVVVLNASNILMQQINYVLINATDLDKEDSIEFTNEQYAAMARALNTVGNYSMNPSYNSRYNINSCFNEMRIDLMYLQDEGVFDFYYKTEDAKGNEIATWQSTLQKIANSADLEKDLKIDLYYESVSNSILEAMELLRVNSYFRPLESFERQYTTTTETIPIDRVVFLTGTLRAAKNSDYNESPSFTDPLRGAYYHGEKSIYDVDQVSADFDIGPATDYIIIFIMVIKLLWDFTVIILNCISRIFNMLVLYIAAPPFIATMSYDDGGKLKQWTTAFLVQSFAVFGSIIAMRLMLIFLPIIIGPELVLFDNPILNYFTKMVIILGAFEAAKKSNGIIIGILADNAGWQSISAGDMRNTARSLRDKVKRWVEGDGRSKGGSASSAQAPAAGKNDDKLPDKPEDAADKNDDNKNAEPEVFKGVPAAPQSKFDNMGRLVATEMWDPEKKTTVPIGNSSGKKGADGKGSGGNAGGGNAGGGNIGGGNAGGGNVGGGNIGGGNIGGGNVGANLQQPPPLMYNQVPDGNGGGNNEPANPEGADNHE